MDTRKMTEPTGEKALEPKPVEKLESDIVTENWNLYKYCRDQRGHRKEVEEMRRNLDMYLGNHWDDATVATLGDRPALTINITAAIVDLIVGQQIESRAEMVYKPKPSSTQERADVLTKLLKQSNDSNDYHRHETQMFFDSIVQRRGYMELTWGFDDNINGEPRLDTLDPAFVMPDPDASSPDPDKWKYVMISRFYTLEEIADIFGDATAEKIQKLSGNASTNASVGDTTQNSDDADLRLSFGDNPTAPPPNTEYDKDAVRKREDGTVLYRVVERQHFKKRLLPHFVYPTGDIRRVPRHLTDDQILDKAIKEDLEIELLPVKTVRLTVSTYNALLFDDWSVYRHFTIIPCFSFFQRGICTSIVDRVLDPQRLLDKATSQILHVVNSTANSGWIVKKGSLTNMTVDGLKEDGSSTGLVIEWDGEHPPEKILPNQIPTGLDKLLNYAIDMTKEVSNASDAARGFSGPEVSGVAINARQKRFGVTMAGPLSNLDWSRKIYARNWLDLIQDFMTTPRVVMVTRQVEYGENLEEPLAVNQINDDGEVINDLTIGEYGVVISSAPATDTFGEGQLEQAVKLKELGVPIPNDEMIMYSNLERRKEVAERIKQSETGGATPGPDPRLIALQLSEMEAKVAKANAEAALAEQKAKHESIRSSGTSMDVAGAVMASPPVAKVADILEMGAESDAGINSGSHTPLL